MEKLRSNLLGCRFALYPMSDNYAEIILGALEKTDTSKVWEKMDMMSTLYVGEQEHLLDCISAVFRHTWRETLHFGGEFTFSRITESSHLFLEELSNFESTLNNSSTAHLGKFPAYARAAIYAADKEETFMLTESIEKLAKKRGLQPKRTPMTIMLKGSSNSLFSFFDEILTLSGKLTESYTLCTSVSANSPTSVDWNAL